MTDKEKQEAYKRIVASEYGKTLLALIRDALKECDESVAYSAGTIVWELVAYCLLYVEIPAGGPSEDVRTLNNVADILREQYEHLQLVIRAENPDPDLTRN